MAAEPARRERWMDVAVGLLGEMWVAGHLQPPSVPFYREPMKRREQLRPRATLVGRKEKRAAAGRSAPGVSIFSVVHFD
jgi:hypothetical protein